MRDTAVAITVEDKTERYAALSVQALAGELVGSSAGGEQPKFAAYAELAPGRRAHVGEVQRRRRMSLHSAGAIC